MFAVRATIYSFFSVPPGSPAVVRLCSQGAPAQRLLWTNLNKCVDPQCLSVHLFEPLSMGKTFRTLESFSQTVWNLQTLTLLFLPIPTFSSAEVSNTVLLSRVYARAEFNSIQCLVLKEMLNMTCTLPLCTFQYKLENRMHVHHRDTDSRTHKHVQS